MAPGLHNVSSKTTLRLAECQGLGVSLGNLDNGGVADSAKAKVEHGAHSDTPPSGLRLTFDQSFQAFPIASQVRQAASDLGAGQLNPGVSDGVSQLTHRRTVVEAAGQWFGLCSCDFATTACLTEREAWEEPCAVQSILRSSAERREWIARRQMR